MKTLLGTIPNQITAIRLMLIPIMWAFAWLELPAWIGYGMLVSSITDFFDGYLARRLKQSSEFGGRFDAFADNLVFPSALLWLWIFQPNVFLDNKLLSIMGIALYFAYISLGLIKFRQFANLHLYSTRIAAVALYFFIPFTLIMGQYNPYLFYGAITLFLISSIECLVVLLMISEFSDHLGSIVYVLRNRNIKR